MPTRKRRLCFNQARAESDAIVAEAQHEADRLADEGAAQAKIVYDGALEQAKSSAQLLKRRALLSAKQEIISSIIEKARASVAQMSDSDYFELLLRMIAKNALSEAGEIRFCETDLKRMPKDFEKDLAKALSDMPGASLTISTEPVSIDGGFVLIYGGVEENCSLHAIFYSLRDLNARQGAGASLLEKRPALCPFGV